MAEIIDPQIVSLDCPPETSIMSISRVSGEMKASIMVTNRVWGEVKEPQSSWPCSDKVLHPIHHHILAERCTMLGSV